MRGRDAKKDAKVVANPGNRDRVRPGSGRRKRHCGIFIRRGFRPENPRKLTKNHTALLSSFSKPIKCDNWSCMYSLIQNSTSQAKHKI